MVRGMIANEDDVGVLGSRNQFDGLVHERQKYRRAANSHKRRRRALIPIPPANHTPLTMSLRRLACAALLATTAVAAEARADFRMCNNSSSRISVSLAYTDGQGWVSEGWWNLKSNACEVLLRGPLAAQFYYVYAMDEKGGEWKGKAYMCTRDREFRIEGRDNCLVRGFDRTGFLEIDTGKDAKSWTVQLTDAAQQPSAARQ